MSLLDLNGLKIVTQSPCVCALIARIYEFCITWSPLIPHQHYFKFFSPPVIVKLHNIPLHFSHVVLIDGFL